MVNFLPTVRLAQSILKRKFPSIDEPLNINPSKLSPSKEPLKNISPGAYFWNFTVLGKQNLLFPKGTVILKVFDITNVVVSNFFCLFS